LYIATNVKQITSTQQKCFAPSSPVWTCIWWWSHIWEGPHH